VVPQLSGGWLISTQPKQATASSGSWKHNYLTKKRQAGHANKQSMYSLMSMGSSHIHKYYEYEKILSS
jgi:hypothetical protein